MNLDLAAIQSSLNSLLTNQVLAIVKAVRGEQLDNVIEKTDGDSATQADIQISQLLGERLPGLVEGSLVIEEESFCQQTWQRLFSHRYLWIVDPIDGTKAFRTKGNSNYCIAVALLEQGQPLLSSVYAPELEYRGQLSCLFEARADQPGARLNGQPLSCPEEIKEKDWGNILCVNHIHRDTELTEREKAIGSLFSRQETIRAFDGHSTLIRYCLVTSQEQPQVFTRREANLWDVVQSAYILTKAGGAVFDQQGKDVFPISFASLGFKATPAGCKLIFPFNVACPSILKDHIIKCFSGGSYGEISRSSGANNTSR